MRYFDLHCDTPHELYRNNARLDQNDGHVSLNKADELSRYAQVMAIWTPKKYDDEKGFANFNKVMDYLNVELYRLRDRVRICYHGEDAVEAWAQDKVAAFLAVEDARLLGNDISRLKVLYGRGVRFLTLCWGGSSCIGGSHDTDMDLTDFGREAVREMLKYGIIQDISHASFDSAFEILDLCEECGRAPIATHMNAYALRVHSRNMRDDQLERLVKLGGIAGVSFCPPHLTGDEPCTSEHVADHIMYYHKYAPDRVCFGSDYDGTELPEDIPDITAVPVITDKLLSHGLIEKDIEDITWNNALAFLRTNLPE